MKKLLLIVTIFSLTIIGHSQDFDPQSLVIKNESISPNFLAPPLSLVAFRTGLGSYRRLMSWNEDFLTKLENEDYSNSNKGQFKLESFTTLLGVSISGNLGIVNFGGQARTSLFWKKFPEASELGAETGSDESMPNDLHDELDLYTTDENLKKDFEEVLDNVLVQKTDNISRKIEHEDVWRHFKQMIDVARELDRYDIVDWGVTDLGFEIGIGVKIEPGVVLVSLGGDYRMRFQWSRSLKYLALRPREKRLLFAENKRQDFFKEVEEVKKSHYQLAQIRLGLTVDTKGDLAVADLSGLASVYVWLQPIASNSSLLPIEKTAVLLKGKQWNRVLRRIVRKSGQITKRAARINKRKQSGEWGVSRVKVFASAGGGASGGVLTVAGTPNIEVDFDHDAWKKKLKFETTSSLSRVDASWKFSTLRVRTRLRAGVAVPWLASLSFRPMVEFFF